MPQITIPLVGEETRRGLAMSASTSKDQFFAACVATRMSNIATRSSSYYLEKRPGLIGGAAVAAGSPGTAIFQSPSTLNPIMAFGGSNSTIYDNATNAGTISGTSFFISETIINGVTHYLITSSDGTGWYLVNGATSDTSFTGDTHTNTVIDNLSGQNGIYIGQLISGTGIQAGTRIATRTPDTSTPTSITTTLATTATNAGVTITKEAIAKIIDADFPSVVGGFASLEGYIFVGTSTGKIYNSDLNSVTSWGGANFIPSDISTDNGMGCIKYKNHIIGFGNQSVEFFFNAGNPSNSPLSSRKENFSQVGMYAGDGPYNSVCQINDNVFWVGNDMGLYTFDGFTPKKLTEMGMKLGSVNLPPFALSAFRLGIDTIIHVNSSTSTFDKWFSVSTGMWFEPNMGVTGANFINNPKPTSTTIAAAIAGGTGGKLYVLDTATYQDDSVSYSLVVQTEPKVLNKGRGFVINSIELLADNQTSGSTTLEISRDDYASFQTLGSFDLTQRRKRIVRGGLCRNHAIFRITDSGNQPWRGQALIVDYTPCAT